MEANVRSWDGALVNASGLQLYPRSSYREAAAGNARGARAR
jgi:hypothetical protein